MSRRLWLLTIIGVLCGVGLSLPQVASGADQPTSSGTVAGPADAVDLFAAVERGELTVKVIPKDDTRVRLQLTNKADRPLTVRIPAAIAAVPVLGQNFGFFNNAANGQPRGAGPFGPNPGAGAGVGNQALGIGGGNPLGAGPGFNQGFGFGPGPNNGFPGGLFSVPEKRVTKIDLPAVCLEYGKRAPNHRIPYELKPLEAFTADPHVAAVVSALNDPRLDREVVQLAAWRVTSGWTWEQMHAMTVRRPWGAVERRFNATSLQAAERLAERLHQTLRSTQPAQTAASLQTGRIAGSVSQ